VLGLSGVSERQISTYRSANRTLHSVSRRGLSSRRPPFLTLMRNVVVATFLLLTVADAPPSRAAAPGLSDAAALTIMQRIWDETATVRIALGTFSVVRDGFANGQALNEKQFHNALIWAKVGIITVGEVSSSQSFNRGQSFSWGQFLNQTVGGVQRQIVVSPTPLGSSLNIRHEPNRLIISQGTFRLTRVVGNELIKRGVDDFRVVRVLYDASWSQAYTNFYAISGAPLSSRRKSIILIKFDPFKDTWIWVAGDYANADSEFTTHDVADKLR